MENRYFISSLNDVETFARAARGHWVVESFHRHPDVSFREDHCRVIDKRAQAKRMNEESMKKGVKECNKE